MAVVTLVASTSSAQAVATNFDQLRLKVKKGDTLFITYQSGGETEASLVEISNNVLLVSQTGRRLEVQESQVRQIRQRLPDPLWQGALIGTVVGVGLGVWSVSFSEDCSHNLQNVCLGPPLLIGAMGAGIGVGIDALVRGRKVIYQAPANGVTSRVTVLPILSRNATGGAVRVTF